MDTNIPTQTAQPSIPISQTVSEMPPKSSSKIKWASISAVGIILIILLVAGAYYLGVKNLSNYSNKSNPHPSAVNKTVNIEKGYIVGINGNQLGWYNSGTQKIGLSSISLSQKQLILFSPDRTKFFTISGDRYNYKDQDRSVTVYEANGKKLLSAKIQFTPGYSISSGMSDIAANFGWGTSGDGIIYYAMKLIKENKVIGGTYDYEFHFISLTDGKDTVIGKMEKNITQETILVLGYDSGAEKLILENEFDGGGGDIFTLQTKTNETSTLVSSGASSHFVFSTDGNDLVHIGDNYKTSQHDATIYALSQKTTNKNLLPLLNLPAKVDYMPRAFPISNNLIAIVYFEMRKYGNTLPAEPVKIILINTTSLNIVKTINITKSLITPGEEWKGVTIEDINENGDMLTNNKLLINDTIINLPTGFEGLSFIR